MILILPRHCPLYMILILPRHCLIYDPDSSLSLSYIWSWIFPVTVLYMILILPCHCLIYDHDFSPSCTALYMIMILPRHVLPDIWSWFFPVTVLYMTKNNWNLSFIHYFFILPFMGHLYIAWQFSPYGEESGYRPHFIGYICILISVSSTYANILKYHIQGMPTNIILQVFI